MVPQHLPPPERHLWLLAPFRRVLAQLSAAAAAGRIGTGGGLEGEPEMRRRGRMNEMEEGEEDDEEEDEEEEDGLSDDVFLYSPWQLSAAHASTPRPFNEAATASLLAYCKCAVASGALGSGAATWDWHAFADLAAQMLPQRLEEVPFPVVDGDELALHALKRDIELPMIYVLTWHWGEERLKARRDGGNPLDLLLATPLPELLLQPPPGFFDGIGGPAPWAALLAALPQEEAAWFQA
jgi:hypothetical protein